MAKNRIVTATGTDAMNAESGLTGWYYTNSRWSCRRCSIIIKADSDNLGELDQPYMEFVLDGGTHTHLLGIHLMCSIMTIQTITH
ncbi:MAG: hypothetical protein CM15mV35_070 [uncultured marine virus]|nr:MAG: hypothetical protein CM15mV35_070 [uncultured marine virus]